MKKNIANCITSIRLIGAFVLIMFDIRSTAFLVVYAICGLSDALDGFVARKLHAESELGKKLDSVSDLSLYSVMLIKAIPLLIEALPPKGLYTIIGLILFRIFLYVVYWLFTRQLLSTHSIYNKIVSIMMFFLPFALQLPFARYYCYATMAVAAVSLVDEVLHFNFKKPQNA
ncbi:MAG: CDP-alcohol phosphatidyltransferase family protein [Erysipelotrichaceae bacterium]|nr:CDP-alcohol phosphatidyltransferase family protein [Erysipelotrichaceae bacterium]